MKDYLSVMRRLYFKQGDIKKFNQKDFMKEIAGAYHYGILEFTQTLLIDLRDGRLTTDELHGELQIALKKSYDEYKATCGLLKIPELNFDEFFLGDK